MSCFTNSTIKFKLQEVPHPKGEKAKSYYPVVADDEKFSAEDLISMIQEHSTFSQGEIAGVMMDMARIIAAKLSDGVRVELPSLGVLSPSIVSNEPITDVDDKLIARNLRVDTIDFAPFASLKKSMHNVRFHRVQGFVQKRVSLSEQELMECIRALCDESADKSFDRDGFQQKTGYKQTKACRVLKTLTEKGVLLKQGKRNSPYYTLNNE